MNVRLFIALVTGLFVNHLDYLQTPQLNFSISCIILKLYILFDAAIVLLDPLAFRTNIVILPVVVLFYQFFLPDQCLFGSYQRPENQPLEKHQKVLQLKKTSKTSQKHSRMAFNFGTGPKTDPYINYCFGVFMIICVSVSMTLNPLIMYSYTRKPKSVQNFLFKVIAVSDFLTNLIPGIFMIYVFFGTVEFKYTTLTQLPEFLSCTFGCISQVTTSLMAVTRMISVIKPFFRVEFKLVLIYLIFYTIYMGIGNAWDLVLTGMRNAQYKERGRNITEKWSHGNANDLEVNSTIENLNKFVCFVMNMTHCILGLLCSFIVVGYLQSRKPIGGSATADHARKLKSCHTILIMNIPYIISIVSNFLSFYQVIEIDFQLVNHYMLPILTSAYNPCVIAIRTNALKGLKRDQMGAMIKRDRMQLRPKGG